MSALFVAFTITHIITIVSAGNSPEYDYTYSTNGGEIGECLFKGTKSTGGDACKSTSVTRKDFKQDADLTWKILTKACPQLIYAGCADPEWKTSEEPMDSLVWPDDCDECPRCPCGNGADDSYYLYNYSSVASSNNFLNSVCYQCRCNDFAINRDTDVKARICTEQSSYHTVSALRDVQCPLDTPAPTPQPTGGCDNGAGDSKAPGEYFFYFDNAECDTYCLCNSTDGLQCAQGWDNILDSDVVKYPFLDTCKGYVRDAFNDSTRWSVRGNCQINGNFMTDFWRCPLADCGEYSDGDEWTGIEYSQTVYTAEDEYEYSLYDCVECDCNNDMLDCDSYHDDSRSEEDCIVSDLQCASDETRDGAITDNGDFENCREGDGETYCGWIKIEAPDGFDADAVCIEDELEVPSTWGCMGDIHCNAMFGYDALHESDTGLCSYNKVKFTAKAYDCLKYDWISETYEMEINLMCCKDNDCNDQRVISETALGEDNQCEYNGNVNQFYKTKYECEYGSHGVGESDFIKQWKCGVPLPEGRFDGEDGVCKMVKGYWEYATHCTCEEYQMYNNAYPNDEYHDEIRDELQLSFDSMYAGTRENLEEWSTQYGCSATFECDIRDSVANYKVFFGFFSVVIVAINML